jgi:hypothetical protein
MSDFHQTSDFHVFRLNPGGLESWVFAPFLTFQYTAASLWCSAAPLLEEEWNVRTPALFVNVLHPLWFHRAKLWSALSTNDHPVNTSKIQFHLAQQWLAREEAYCGRYLAQLIDPKRGVLIFNRRANPNVWRDRAVCKEIRVPRIKP